MKLISLACPNCHAQLQVNQELKQASCNYCGYSFLIDLRLQAKSRYHKENGAVCKAYRHLGCEVPGESAIKEMGG